MAELCRAYGVSRKTGYKWVERFLEDGSRGLRDQSRAPKQRRNWVCPTGLQFLLELRRRYPRWGPRKLIAYAARHHPELSLPSHATLSRTLRDCGMSRPQKTAHRPPGYCSPYGDYYGPNAAWSADYKGEFRMRNMHLCHPLTIQDVTSRFLLRCRGLPHTKTQPAMKTFDETFCEFGLPDVMRTDNGSPFSSPAPGGLSTLSVWWIQLGIHPHRIPPGRPTYNSRHERMHRTLKEECPPAENAKDQQHDFDTFTKRFNTERPHQALNDRTPEDVYVPSTRPYPTKLRDPEYPDEFFLDRVGTDGALRFQGTTARISTVLAGQLVGLQRLEGRTWEVFFGPVYLGVWNLKGFRPRTRKRTLKPNTVSPML